MLSRRKWIYSRASHLINILPQCQTSERSTCLRFLNLVQSTGSTQRKLHCWCVFWKINLAMVNSQVSSWFCRTNDPVICRYPVLDVVVSEKCFKKLPLKFYFRPFGDIRSNRKWNFKGSSDQSHFIFEINVGISRIRHSTTLNLNGVIFNWFWANL